MTDARHDPDAPGGSAHPEERRQDDASLGSDPGQDPEVRGVDTAALPGMNPDEQPGIPDDPMSPAEGGD